MGAIGLIMWCSNDCSDKGEGINGTVTSHSGIIIAIAKLLQNNRCVFSRINEKVDLTTKIFTIRTIILKCRNLIDFSVLQLGEF